MSEGSVDDEPAAGATTNAPATQVTPNALFEAAPDPEGSLQGSTVQPPALPLPPTEFSGKRASGRSNKNVPPQRYNPDAFKKYATGLPKAKSNVAFSNPVAFLL